ncbi:hypothetical protein Hanom_Chr01g00025151 [Helianthus anomalus]
MIVIACSNKQATCSTPEVGSFMMLLQKLNKQIKLNAILSSDGELKRIHKKGTKEDICGCLTLGCLTYLKCPDLSLDCTKKVKEL